MKERLSSLDDGDVKSDQKQKRESSRSEEVFTDACSRLWPRQTGRRIVRRSVRSPAVSASVNATSVHSMQHSMGRTAALILEPVQGEGGVRVLDKAFVGELRAMTKERGIALIFDEIQCGLGRLGSFFAYEQFDARPDMVTLAKPIAGGLPMGAILVSAEIGDTIKPGDHGTTFGGGPLVARVALEVVRRIKYPALLAAVRQNGEWLGESLRGVARRTGKIRAIRGAGYMWGLDVVEKAGDVIERGWDEGLLVISAGDHTLRLLPPLIMTRDQLTRGVNSLEKILS